MQRSLIVDPGMAAALLSGRKTQVRVGAASGLARCVPGDRIWVRESCPAAFVIFHDGWRRDRDGGGTPGRRPGDTDYKWIAAWHMPRWASRITLVVEAVRHERLQQITRDDIRAEGARPLFGGSLWRWPRPIPGADLTARRAFARYWNVNHPTPGDRWEADPAIAVLTFRLAPEAT
eukprot:gene32686-biopygen21108